MELPKNLETGRVQADHRAPLRSRGQPPTHRSRLCPNRPPAAHQSLLCTISLRPIQEERWSFSRRPFEALEKGPQEIDRGTSAMARKSHDSAEIGCLATDCPLQSLPRSLGRHHRQDDPWRLLQARRCQVSKASQKFGNFILSTAAARSTSGVP